MYKVERKYVGLEPETLRALYVTSAYNEPKARVARGPDRRVAAYRRKTKLSASYRSGRRGPHRIDRPDASLGRRQNSPNGRRMLTERRVGYSFKRFDYTTAEARSIARANFLLEGPHTGRAPRSVWDSLARLLFEADKAGASTEGLAKLVKEYLDIVKDFNENFI